MLKELVKKSRSYRAFNEDRVITKEELLELVDLTRYCPSTVNRQPLKYYLAWEKEEVEKILATTTWAKALKDIKLPYDGKHPTAFIIICQDTDVDANLNRFLRDVGLVAQTMILGAVEKDLGGIMIGSFHAGKVTEIMSMPENIHPMLVLAFGEPAEEIILHEVDPEDSIGYYRDENDVHHVPKRKLSDIVLNGGK